MRNILTALMMSLLLAGPSIAEEQIPGGSMQRMPSGGPLPFFLNCIAEGKDLPPEAQQEKRDACFRKFVGKVKECASGPQIEPGVEGFINKCMPVKMADPNSPSIACTVAIQKFRQGEILELPPECAGWIEPDPAFQACVAQARQRPEAERGRAVSECMPLMRQKTQPTPAAVAPQ